MIYRKKNTMVANVSILAVLVSSYASGTYAAMDPTSVLSFTAATTAGLVQPAPGTGSWFGMEAGDFDFDGVIDTIHTPISSVEGIKLSVIQTPSGSHTGLPDGSESPTVDNPWGFFSNTGMHGSIGTAITINTDDGTGNVTFDMTGWNVDWNGDLIDMGQGADAVITCANTCEFGDTFTLDYAAVVPTGSFTGVPYSLHLEGAISAPPAFNTAPVAVQDDFIVDRKASGRVYAPSVLDIIANDTDADGNSDIDRTTVSIIAPANGTTDIDPVTGNITYTPVDDSLASDSFTYEVTDLGGPPAAPEGPLVSNVVTVNITVQNAVPVAVDDVDSIDVAISTTVLIDVASNDTDSDGSIVASSASVNITTDVTDGSTVVETNGSVTYTPNNGFIGTDSFQYTIMDNDNVSSSQATVVINVSDSSVDGLSDSAFLIISAGTGEPGKGSLFSMEVNPGQLTYTGLTGFDHIQLGATQLGSDVMPGIDEPWLFFGNLGVHQSTSEITKLTDDGAGNVTLDFLGWDVSWNKIASIPLGAGPDNGVATLTCDITCAAGESFTLIYHATVPEGDPSSFGGVSYILELVGVIADGVPTLGGGDDSVAFDVTTVSAVDDSTASTPTPVSIGPGAIAVAAGNATGVHLTADEIGSKDPLLNDKDGTQCQGGCMDLIATGVTSDFIDVVFTLNAPIEDGGIYRKLINGKWQGYDTSGFDQLGSANADASGNCQGPEGKFNVGLRAGAQCVFLRIYDGGLNDDDGVKNGTIVDPSGVLIAGSPNRPSGSTDSSIGGVNWAFITMLMFTIGMGRLRRA